MSRAPAATAPKPVVIFLPRLDLPWGERHKSAPVPLLQPSVRELRLHWKDFAIRLANAFEHLGLRVRIVEVANTEITAERIDAEGGALAFVPHRCKLDFAPGKTPVLYFMQEYFRWCFVIDKDGWSAASSRYPFAPDRHDPASPDRFSHYQQALRQGQLSSKFAQSAKQDVAELRARGQLPDRDFIFFPLQIPHDQSLRYFSDLEEVAVVERLSEWCLASDVPLVLKPHPANLKVCADFAEFVVPEKIYWSEAHIYDLIDAAAAVYTINSGVGFESLFAGKPVVMFGRAPYDCVCFRAAPDRMDEAWDYCRSVERGALLEKYAAFVNWFFNEYVFDLENEQRVTAQFLELVRGAKAEYALSGRR